MKKVLSLLVAFVFLQVQSWALSGGPSYGSINNSVSGTYAGLLIGDIGNNGLGMFQLGMPTAGLGSGTFAFFAGGGAFFGTVVGLADGEKSSLDGVLKGTLKATSNLGAIINLNTGAATNINTLVDVALMGGKFITKLEGSSSSGGGIGVGSRIVGTADVTVTGSGNGPVPPGITVGNSTLVVDGFQQSSAVTGQVSLSQLTGTTAAGG